MKNVIYIMLLVFVSTMAVSAQQKTSKTNINIIPMPVSLKVDEGHFRITSKTTLFVSGNITEQSKTFLINLLQKSIGDPLPVINTERQKKIIKLIINQVNQQRLGREGYTMKVTPNAITIKANELNGLFYGIQTLLQLLPPFVVNENKRDKQRWEVPCLEIMDFPRFKWRGVMLDVSRHFFSKSYIEQLLNEMSKYKFNVFHWHLTDDQGWRIQIKGLPKLTEVGAWRVPRSGGMFGEYKDPQPGEKATCGGYYTQNDIREIVQYAKERYITIVPEIDMPGHSMALIASYPNISCRQEPAEVNPGSPLTKKWDDVLCTANDSTYIILDTIFSQVARLFPGPYIHIGGDEVYKGFWKEDPKDQKLMVEKHIKNVEELQGYFIKKVSKMIQEKGERVIGWEEILEGGLPPGDIVESWTSMKAGIKAAKMGHEVIMAPWNHGLYMDNSPIERSYNFDPVPNGIDKNLIMGGEGCLWTEDVTDENKAEFMYWPRLMALSEVFWTPLDKKDWVNFSRRMEAQFPRLDAADINYSKNVYNPIVRSVKDTITGGINIKLRTEIKGLTIYYSFNNSDPGKNYPQYKGGLLTPPKDATNIKAVSYRDGKPIGNVVTVSLKDLSRWSYHND